MTGTAAGGEALLRYRYRDGSFQAAFPLTVVEDTPERFVGWLAVGTPIMYWALPDGADPRSIDLAERFKQPITTAARTWEGSSVLRVLPTGRPYQVLHFWSPSGAFKGWYVNFERPAHRTGSRIDTVDWHLDLWIDPDGAWRWKDEDEAAFAVADGHLSEDDLLLARESGRSIVEDLDGFLTLIGDWRSSAPDVTWAPLLLPPDWNT